MGTEYNRDVINLALSGDEAALRSMNLSRDYSGHGTFVTGIAAGNGQGMAGSFRGVAFESELIIVKLGDSEQRQFPRTTRLMEAVNYCIMEAQKAGKPVVINLSFGNNQGSHDGTDLLSTYLNAASDVWKNVIVCGSGNEAGNGIHASGMLSGRKAESVELAVGEYESGFNLQLWKNYNDRFDVMIITPNGDIVLTLSESQNIGTGTYRNTFVKGIYGTPNPYNRNQEIFISFQGRDNYIDKGQWKVLIHPKQIVSGVVDAYLPIRASLTGNVEFLNPTEFGTLTIPSTAEGLITVAAYDQNVDDFAYFSGRGYTANDQIKPDLAAPGVDIYTAYPGNDYSFASGTSMAVPFVSGSACLLMQWGIVNENDPFLYGEKLKASLIRGAKRIKSARTYPNIYVGWGTLCVENSIR